MANEGGVPLDHIINTLNQLRDSMGVYFVVDDLKNLVTGGRLSKTGALAGGLLKIKPILTLSEDTHEIIPIGKIRTIKKALVDIEERFKTVYEQRTHPLHVMLMGTNNEPLLKSGKLTLNPDFPMFLLKSTKSDL
nr:DegV family protein [Lentilactobacillus senioris]